MQSRRKFLKLGAGAAIGGLAVASLPKTAAAHPSDETAWDETVDVIVIGSGFAGLSAALNAKRKKLGSILVLEKMQVIGGNSAINGGWFAVPKNPIQLSQGILDDSPEELVNDQMIAGRGMANKEILTKVANRALDAYQMCIDAGVEFRKDFNIQVGGHNKARAIRTKHGTGGDITTKLYEAGRREGVEYRLQHYIEDFVRVGDKIEGVVVRRGYRFPDQGTGELVRIKANKAVICASGGFARDMKLRAVVDPSLDPTLDCTNHLGATGEVMLSAAANGALPIHLNMIQTGHWGSPDEGGFGWSNALLSIGWHEGISVSVLSGKRYMDERTDRLTASTAIMNNRYSDGSPAYPLVFFNYNDHPDDDRVVRALRDEMAWKVDSLEQLASKFNVPLDALKKTVKEYNEHVAQGTDPDFGRKMDTAKVLKAPFVVSRIWPKVHYCMGGLKTDADGRVLDARTMSPIKNFYAAGEVTGGVHGQTRLSSCSCLETLTMGFIISEAIKANA
ncbi:flavocytochrome c [Desulfuromonas versatilis]|uniref:Flavocytochrome c n=1 Tax=Desulfuromonas versatilis TaxID=2802975 RepID=A0ABM8HSM4_9BACT|nr:flavocytochrome c [Desulfuromonas versatilis]BCR06015.1 flavocytochrome c [Desulfuromonas versatilis]